VGAIAIVFLGHEKYGLRSIGFPKTESVRALREIMKGKVGLRSTAQQIDLPVFGHLAIRVHRGYKVFDFRRSEVIKVFNEDTTIADIDNEIAASMMASAVSSAPRHISLGPDRRWYTEEYISGTHATQIVEGPNSQFINYYSEVENCQLELVSSQLQQTVDPRDHFDGLSDDSFRARWLASGIESGVVDRIAEYVTRLHKWLAEKSGPEKLPLVLTHGDFSLVNAISTDSGLRFIDWEGIGAGGALSDVFNFVFVERYYDRASPDFVAEACNFVTRYRDAVIAHSPQLKSISTSNLVYARRLYYLERMKLLLDREVTANLSNVVDKSIALFNDFDRESGVIAF